MLLTKSAFPASVPKDRLHVLLVDDDEDMRLYLAGCLRGFCPPNVSITEAHNGREALLLARSFPFDLIISDVLMPGLTGRAVCRALKNDPKTATVPVLLFSGESETPCPFADGFLAKPFNAIGLRTQVERLLAPAPASDQASEQASGHPTNQ